jgi:peroxiredoxin
MGISAIPVGAEAPDFELPSSEKGANGKPGKRIRLSDYRGRCNVLLAFYPMDFSPICTVENASFQEEAARFLATGTQVLGISVDSAWSHGVFARELGLTYPLLADFHPKGEVARRYGLYLEESGYSARASVVVDRAGKVALVKIQQIPEPRANREILAFLESLPR